LKQSLIDDNSNVNKNSKKYKKMQMQ
jgi:hypothetical protein